MTALHGLIWTTSVMNYYAYISFFSKFMLKCTNDIMSVLIYMTPQKTRQVQFLSRLKSTAPAAAQVSVARGVITLIR